MTYNPSPRQFLLSSLPSHTTTARICKNASTLTLNYPQILFLIYSDYMHSYQYYGREEVVNELRIFISTLTKKNILKTRASLTTSLNGDTFYPLHTWPLKMQIIFTSIPMSDSETFKFLLFMYGNGCPPYLCIKYLCTSFFFAKTSRLRRLYQIKWICRNFEHHKSDWYYYDIHSQSIKYLNGANKEILPQSP